MEEGRPSSTANVAALLRAAHLLLDDEPKILEDTLAPALIGAESKAAVQAKLEAMAAGLQPCLSPELAQNMLIMGRAFMCTRSRYTEDELEQALKRGVTQYVILGAGLDSFAYRRPDLAKLVQVFEVDHPATQAWKRARLQELGVDLPPNLTFVPVDFEKQELAEALTAGGYKPEEPAFFSWLGVTMYLSQEAVFKTLGMVAASAPGSEIVFTYNLPDSLVDPESLRIVTCNRARLAADGERVITFFEPESLAVQVKAMGFTEVWDFGFEEASKRYLAGRADGLRMPTFANHMKARR